MLAPRSGFVLHRPATHRRPELTRQLEPGEFVYALGGPHCVGFQFPLRDVEKPILAQGGPRHDRLADAVGEEVERLTPQLDRIGLPVW